MLKTALRIAGISMALACAACSSGGGGGGGGKSGTNSSSSSLAGGGGAAGSSTIGSGGGADTGSSTFAGTGGNAGNGGSSATTTTGKADAAAPVVDAFVGKPDAPRTLESEAGGKGDLSLAPDHKAAEGGTAASEGDGGSTATGPCDRAGLQAAVDSYLAAIAAKDSSKMSLASSVKYTESISARSSDKAVALGTGGLWQSTLPVKYSRSLLDVTGCETFTEVFITEGSHPYVLGTRLKLADGKISEIQVIVTDSDDWNFDAKAYQACSESEDWRPLSAADQSTREKLIDAGQKYFDVFSDKSAAVPWGTPCYRLEGGKGCTPQVDKASKSCNFGIPENITFKNTHWVVDVDVGGVVGITLFSSSLPDTHMFRVVAGKIVNIHTLTCTGSE